MTKITFKVEMSPYPFIGQWMRAANLCDGVFCGYTHFTIMWKDGEIVDDKRIEKARLNLKKALERSHYDCYTIVRV